MGLQVGVLRGAVLAAGPHAGEFPMVPQREKVEQRHKLEFWIWGVWRSAYLCLSTLPCVDEWRFSSALPAKVLGQEGQGHRKVPLAGDVALTIDIAGHGFGGWILSG